jgi:hypothetical protein
MPVMGLFAYSFYRYLTHIAFKWNFSFLIINDRQALVELQEQKNKLRVILFGEK